MAYGVAIACLMLLSGQFWRGASAAPAPAKASLPSGGLMVGYYETWSTRMMPNGEMDLANIPAYVNVVALSFASPDCTYVKGELIGDVTFGL